MAVAPGGWWRRELWWSVSEWLWGLHLFSVEVMEVVVAGGSGG